MKLFKNLLKTGYPDDVLGDLEATVERLMRGASQVYIGATAGYEARYVEHVELGVGWDHMGLLYRTGSHAHAIEVEEALIGHANAVNETKVRNVGRGGEGLRPGYSYYWVYILREKAGSRRH